MNACKKKFGIYGMINMVDQSVTDYNIVVFATINEALFKLVARLGRLLSNSQCLCNLAHKFVLSLVK